MQTYREKLKGTSPEVIKNQSCFCGSNWLAMNSHDKHETLAIFQMQPFLNFRSLCRAAVLKRTSLTCQPQYFGGKFIISVMPQ